MKKMLFATNNANKLKEVREIIGDSYEIISLADVGYTEDIPETGKTFEENAQIKALAALSDLYMPCIGEDSGLQVEAINNEPGVYSARYCKDHDVSANIAKVLEKLGNNKNRKAKFVTTICYVSPESQAINMFRGELSGTITFEKRGSNGFGYDNIFIPNGYDKTLAELSSEEKNKISQRYKAINFFRNFLEKNKQ